MKKYTHASLKILSCAALFTLSLGMTQAITAATLAYDDFSYPSVGTPPDGNPLAGNNGGDGWSGAWSASATNQVDDSGNLSYTATGYSNLQTGTGRVHTTGTLGNVTGRALENSIAGTSGGTELWASALVNAGSNGRSGFYFNVADLGNTSSVRGSTDAGFLLVGTDFRTLSDGSLASSAAFTLSSNITHLIIMKVTLLDAGSSTIDFWADPTNVTSIANLGTADTSITANFGGSISSFAVETYSRGAMDAVRIGTDLASVAIPESSNFALIAMSVLTIAMRRGVRSARS